MTDDDHHPRIVASLMEEVRQSIYALNEVVLYLAEAERHQNKNAAHYLGSARKFIAVVSQTKLPRVIDEIDKLPAAPAPRLKER